MKRLESMAFDWADENCGCETEELYGQCRAKDLKRAYEAGFLKAREMALAAFTSSQWRYSGWTFPEAFLAVGIDLERLGEEDES